MANKLVKGTLILSVATLFTKVIGSLFWAPFQNIAGDETVGLYRISFPFYSILLMVASAGIPITVSKFVAERLSRGDRMGARQVLKAASLILTISGLCAFSLLFFGADFISRVLLENPPTKPSLQMLAFAILIVPVMGVYRGYFQGHQQMMPTGISQVVEQIIRVGTVIGLTYWMVQAHFSKEIVAAGATSGAFAGAIGGLFIVLWYNHRDRKQALISDRQQETFKPEPLRPLAKEIIRYAIPISLATLVLPLIGLIDSFSVPRLLMARGFDEEMTNTLFGIYSRGEPFVNVISTFSSALTLALIPAISAHVAKQEMEAVERKISQAWLMTLVIGLPCSVGLAILARPLNIMMYKNGDGTTTLAVLAFSAIFSTLAVTSSGILQGLGYNKLPVRHLLIGAAVKITANIIFIPVFGIAGSALAMVIAYLVVCCLNMWMVMRKTKVRVHITGNFIKPLFCTLIMAGALFCINTGIHHWMDLNGATRLTYTFLSLLLCGFGAVIYGIALLLTGTIGENELRLLPMGTRLVQLFKKLKLMRPAENTISS
ncbi:oligosaccharide flippase family protein [Paenactinomyces guangxiensis]|uniref:Polysaccharide biosynthesis protein n=1 Tax=Paenactinomyces guangxiensis TaxID=1490290 RepID=A0A7W2A820_9BACL|nr:polysaccharide biosynthesis protein [Paenactinomyces guangxiensis]MBA4494195.1 polysaccharide biosynthesis protein [Paenactinomyces guangxiensis]MBH8590691.1 polysaccharide biosynthesis protein [Paenactinomyces guangxiensis]